MTHGHQSYEDYARAHPGAAQAGAHQTEWRDRLLTLHTSGEIIAWYPYYQLGKVRVTLLLDYPPPSPTPVSPEPPNPHPAR